MDAFDGDVEAPQLLDDGVDPTSPSGSSARDLLEHVVHEGAPADRDASAEALLLPPSDGQPNGQQVLDAHFALGESLVVGLEGSGRLIGLSLNPTRHRLLRNLVAASGLLRTRM